MSHPRGTSTKPPIAVSCQSSSTIATATLPAAAMSPAERRRRRVLSRGEGSGSGEGRLTRWERCLVSGRPRPLSSSAILRVEQTDVEHPVRRSHAGCWQRHVQQWQGSAWARASVPKPIVSDQQPARAPRVPTRSRAAPPPTSWKSRQQQARSRALQDGTGRSAEAVPCRERQHLFRQRGWNACGLWIFTACRSSWPKLTSAGPRC